MRGKLKTTSEVLKLFDGLTKRKLYYLEESGLIKSVRKGSGRYERRYYAEKDIDTISTIWEFYKEDFSPKVAYEKAMEKARHSLTESSIFDSEDFRIKSIISDSILGNEMRINNSLDLMDTLGSPSLADKKVINIPENLSFKPTSQIISKLANLTFDTIRSSEVNTLIAFDSISSLVAGAVSLIWQESGRSPISISNYLKCVDDFKEMLSISNASGTPSPSSE